MKRIVFLFFLMSCLNGFTQTDDVVLMSIGEHHISKGEFVNLYHKNNKNLSSISEKKSVKEYLKLFTNFKLKVLEAEELKMDTSQAFVNELAGYRKELAASYLTNFDISDKLVAETYQRIKTELSASHILLNLDENASPADTLKIYNQLLKIRSEIIAGLDFNNAAVKYSQDPSAKINLGNLNYFSAFQMVTAFEDAAYTTPIGQISMPVRTNYGYHILKINDKRPARGEIKVAHIMKNVPKNATDSDKKRIKEEIEKIYSKLQNGEDFGDLAKLYSDDKRSAENKGLLPWFNAGKMIGEFAEPAFALKNDNDYTQPVLTPYGYHIIKRIEYRPIKSFEELQPEIISRLKRDVNRGDKQKKIFVEKLKKEYNYSLSDDNYSKFINYGQNYIDQGKWLPEKEFLDQPLFTLDGKSFGSSLFSEYLKKAVFPKETKNKTQVLNQLYTAWESQEIIAYEDALLEKKYPEFRYLMQEYHDGILLFNLSDKKIWSYAANDSIGLASFYTNTKKKILWEERFKGLVIKCKNQEVRDEVEKYFDAGLNATEIKDLVNAEKEMVTIEDGAWEQGTNNVVDYYVWNNQTVSINEELEFIRGDKIKPEPKTLNEAKGLYISEYQNFLEKEWIKELKKKYKVKIYKKNLKTIKDA